MQPCRCSDQSHREINRSLEQKAPRKYTQHCKGSNGRAKEEEEFNIRKRIELPIPQPLAIEYYRRGFLLLRMGPS